MVVLTTGTFRIVDHFNGHQIETIVASDTGQSMVLANGLIGGNGNGIIAGTHRGRHSTAAAAMIFCSPAMVATA